MTKSKSIYEFDDYKDYFNFWVSQLPKGGYGEYRRVSQTLSVSTTLISQVFKGDKQLSAEMASELCDYMRLSDNEADYFLLMLDLQKAGSFKLKNRLKRQIERRKEQARDLQHRVQKDRELSEEDKAVFYSSWIYSGVRLLTDIESINDIQDLSLRLNLSMAVVEKVVNFLLEKKLILRKSDTGYKLGPTRTYTKSSSLLTTKHHQNWRLMGFNKMIVNEPQNLFFTSPMVLSEEVAFQIRESLPTLIEEIMAKVPDSKSEVVRCLNIDWFEY